MYLSLWNKLTIRQQEALYRRFKNRLEYLTK